MKQQSKNINIRSYAKASLMLLSAVFFLQCTTEETPFYPSDEERLSIVSVLANDKEILPESKGTKVDAAFSIIFNKPIDLTAITSALDLSTNQSAVNYTLTINDNQSIIAISPNDSLAWETIHTLRIKAGAHGLENESLLEDFFLSFTTEIEPKPLFAAGTGTEADPYLIENGEQLDIVRLFPDSHFKVIANIDATSVSAIDAMGWRPIGNLDEAFIGKFNGDGYKIRGLTIARPEQTEVGLFGVLGAGGCIQNLIVEAVNISGNQATGALVGRQLNGSILNCHSSGSISSVDSRIGGLVGSQEAGTISQSSSSCGVRSDISRVGGLVGLSQAGRIISSFSSGNCESLSSRVGGLVGSLEAEASILDCYATGNIAGKNRVGALVGRLDGTARRAYATGSVTVTDTDDSGDYAGHVMGQLDNAATIADLYYPTTQSINYSGGADITKDGTEIAISSLSCATPKASFANFDFSTVWNCVADGSWIKLNWE